MSVKEKDGDTDVVIYGSVLRFYEETGVTIVRPAPFPNLLDPFFSYLEKKRDVRISKRKFVSKKRRLQEGEEAEEDENDDSLLKIKKKKSVGRPVNCMVFEAEEEKDLFWMEVKIPFWPARYWDCLCFRVTRFPNLVDKIHQHISKHLEFLGSDSCLILVEKRDGMKLKKNYFHAIGDAMTFFNFKVSKLVTQSRIFPLGELENAAEFDSIGVESKEAEPWSEICTEITRGLKPVNTFSFFELPGENEIAAHHTHMFTLESMVKYRSSFFQMDKEKMATLFSSFDLVSGKIGWEYILPILLSIENHAREIFCSEIYHAHSNSTIDMVKSSTSMLEFWEKGLDLFMSSGMSPGNKKCWNHIPTLNHVKDGIIFNVKLFFEYARKFPSFCFCAFFMCRFQFRDADSSSLSQFFENLFNSNTFIRGPEAEIFRNGFQLMDKHFPISFRTKGIKKLQLQKTYLDSGVRGDQQKEGE